ncbi:MAG TPA: hypothetical protein V6D22_08910 [Candidatus Obscuribacterales bacterium]
MNKLDNRDLSFLYDFVCECPNPRIAAALRSLVDYWLSHSPDEPKLASLSSLQDILSNEELIQVSWLLAVNPKTPPTVLQDLCKEAPTALLEKITENSRSGSSADLPYQAIAEIRIATAGNTQTPLASIMLLVKDDDADVRYSMAENHKLPAEALHLLAHDDNPFVKYRAEKTLSRIAEGR